MNTEKLVELVLRVPKQYTQPLVSVKNDRIIILVHHNWLSSLLSTQSIPNFTFHESLILEEVEAALLQNQEFSSSWQRVLVRVIPKPPLGEQAVSLLRPRTSQSGEEAGLTYPQLMHYVSLTNYKNLWKHQYKKYLGRIRRKSKDSLKGLSIREASSVLKDVLTRFYGCPIINAAAVGHSKKKSEFQCHVNILQAACIIETTTGFVLLHPISAACTLKDYVTFSPNVFINTLSKPLFIIYQVLQAMRESHDRALILGDIRLEDVFITPDLFIQIIPDISSNVFRVERNINAPTSIPRSPVDNSLATLSQKWIRGELSNYDYLMHLNAAAGRRFGNPCCHFVLPWVSDLSTRGSGPWRDLSKSQFRLNKGDRQLDLTYDHASSSQVPHHVSDVLSEITYYVYLARRTPKSLLCKYVRSSWVPAEYPSSIQRLQAWTPDECIPEFFTDPSIFNSIHEDLCDLELPPWAPTPEEFVTAHREQLESRRVSERLHYWIDLTFGYKLSGTAAVKAKNVCLNLASAHSALSTTGVVQVFNHPHPRRQTPLPGFDKQPPKPRSKPRSAAATDEDVPGQHSSDNEDEDGGDQKSSPLLLHRFLSLSRSSLLAPFQSSSEETTGQKSSGTSTVSTSSSQATGIKMSKEANPYSLLNAVEAGLSFHMKTFGERPISPEMDDGTSGVKQIIASRRLQEMQILGCFIMEIFLDPQLRVRSAKSVEDRISICAKLIANDSLPNCVRPALRLLLEKFPPITDIGLPPPSAHQILQPLLSSFLIPFPTKMPQLYAAVSRLKALGTCEGTEDLRVNLFSSDLDVFLDEQSLDLVFPFVKELLTNQGTTSLTLTLLLDKVLKLLGVAKTNELLLDTLLGLYERVPMESYLYQRRFLLTLMIRCGLHVFLHNFVTLIIEAIGRVGSHPNLDREVCDEEESSPEVEDSQPVPPAPSAADPSPELAVFNFDREDTPSDGESLHNLMEHLATSDDEDMDTSSEADKSANLLRSPPIPVAQSSWTNQVTSIECEVGSKNSEILSIQPVRTFNELSTNVDTTSIIVDSDAEKVQEVAADSILWLSRRVGPVLTAKHISRNLLKMLTLCYTGSGALAPAPLTADEERGWWRISVSQHKVIGDENAAEVVKSLSHLVELYGEQFILVQYLPFMSELIAISKRKLTYTVEGGVVGSLALLRHVVSLLSDTTLMDHLQDVILKNIVHPLVRLMVSKRFPFPSGYAGRLSLATKLVDTLYFLALHIGAEMTKVHLAVPSLQRFFLAFDKAAGIRVYTGEELIGNNNDNTEESQNFQIELQKVFSAELAHASYLAFVRFLGEPAMENALLNHQAIRRLCVRHEQQTDPSFARARGTVSRTYLTDFFNTVDYPMDEGGSGSFGSNVAVIGNKIEIQGPPDPPDLNCSSPFSMPSLARSSKDTSRHLRGNWLAYWEHEIGRSEKDTRFNFKQIKLQSFSGHGNSVRCLSVLDNENSFVSGSRDKTVKLWSLRSQGDGSAVSPCQFTYSGHRKSILALSYLPGPRLIASCDSTVRLWDPFVGRTIATIDQVKTAPFSALKAVPGPGMYLIAGTTESTLRIIDIKTASAVSEFKISWNPAGLIRSLCISAEGNWVAVGQSSGMLTVLDLRTGLLLGTWKGHEGEVLQLTAVNKHTLLSSSLDQSVSVWNISDGKLKFHLKGPTEPVLCLQTHGSELISGTTANRVGVHTAISGQSGFSSTKLRSDTFKGVLTSMAVLPLNMQLLLGADNGNITLLC